MSYDLSDELLARLERECAQIHTIGDLEAYAQRLPAPIGILFLNAIRYFSDPCVTVTGGVSKRDWAEVNKRGKLGSYFQWKPDTVVTKDLYWPLSNFIIQTRAFRELAESMLQAEICRQEGYGSYPASVLQQIKDLIRKNAPYLTESIVKQQFEKVRQTYNEEVWGKDEIQNLVFLSLVKKYPNCYRKIDGEIVPYWDSPDVQALQLEFQSYL